MKYYIYIILIFFLTACEDNKYTMVSLLKGMLVYLLGVLREWQALSLEQTRVMLFVGIVYLKR